MIKQELVNHIALETGQSKVAVQLTIDALTATVERNLRKGGTVQLMGFGKFHVVKKVARKGRNPRTGEVMRIKAKRIAKFTPGKGLVDAVQNT